MSLDFFLYNDPPGADTLWDLMLNSGVSEELPPDVFSGLLKAWLSFKEDEDLEILTFEESVKVYNKTYIKNYNKSANSPYNEEDGVWWPESVPCKGWFPKSVVVRLAEILVSKEIAKQEATVAWLRKNRPGMFERRD